MSNTSPLVPVPHTAEDGNPGRGVIYGAIFASAFWILAGGIVWIGHRWAEPWAVILSIAIALFTGIVVVRALKEDEQPATRSGRPGVPEASRSTRPAHGVK